MWVLNLLKIQLFCQYSHYVIGKSVHCVIGFINLLDHEYRRHLEKETQVDYSTIDSLLTSLKTLELLLPTLKNRLFFCKLLPTFDLRWISFFCSLTTSFLFDFFSLDYNYKCEMTVFNFNYKRERIELTWKAVTFNFNLLVVGSCTAAKAVAINREMKIEGFIFPRNADQLTFPELHSETQCQCALLFACINSLPHPEFSGLNLVSSGSQC